LKTKTAVQKVTVFVYFERYETKTVKVTEREILHCVQNDKRLDIHNFLDGL